MMRLGPVLAIAGLSLCVLGRPVPVSAQVRPAPQVPAPQAPAAVARLLVTVVDATGGVIPSATVTVVALDLAPAAATIPAVVTSPQGLATITGLAPGRYSIQAEFQGFETSILKDVRLRAGDNRQAIILALPRLRDSVTVGVDRQVTAADRSQAFGSALTREQIAALSDDPDVMAQQLQDIAGIDAVIRVDSFEGSALPPKAQIKSIHVTRDAFAAENHSAGGLFIDIITQPGVGPVRGGLNYRLRDGSMSGRSPFTPTKGPEQIQNYGLNFGGSLAKDRSSFSLSTSGQHSYDTPIVNAALAGGATQSETLKLRSPRDNIFISGLFDYAINRDQTLRVGYNQSTFKNSNIGTGDYNLPSRAYSNESHNYFLRAQEAGPLGRRFFTNTRIQLGLSDSASHSVVEQPTVRVTEAFTDGGQQIRGGRHSRSVNLASDLDYVRGIHSVRTGISMDGGRYRSDNQQNYLGTYTFESLDAYTAGTPRSYTKQVGDPNIEYGYITGGVYLQDDIRVRRNLTLSPGVRYEKMLHVNDNFNVGPRFGVTWAPFRSGRTTLRASTGMFYDWMSSGTYERAIQTDGFLDPGNIGGVPPTDRYVLSRDLQLPTFKRVSAGVDQTLSTRVRVSVTYAYTRGSNQWRGSNLNAPVNGVRLDPAFANIVQVVSDGRSIQHSLNTNFSVSLARATAPSGGSIGLVSGPGGGAPIGVLLNGGDRAPAPPPPPGAARATTSRRFDWRRLNINGNYQLGRNRTNTADGVFGLPASGTVEGEWGPSNGDVRHRVNIGINSSQLRNLNANLNMNIASGSPYNIRSGHDDNGDLVFNDRPAGVSRNSARGGGQWTLNSNLFYTIGFGKTAVSAPPGIQIIAGGGGAPTVNVINAPPAPRYRMSLQLNAQNITNHANYGSYNGTMTSPLFGRATMVINPRKVDVGLGFSF
jgi:hypothetical protein